MSVPTFTAPGPGAWELESTHMSRPVTRFFEEIFPQAFRRGFSAGSARYGLLLDHLEYRFVNRFGYVAARPVGAPPGATAPPPRPIFWVLARVHPEMRRRAKSAHAAFEHKLWREDLGQWDTEIKPATIKRQLDLVAVDPRELSDDALVAHLAACRANLERMIEQHHRYTVACSLPVGDYLVQTQEWTGLGASELLGLLKGATPESAGDSEELAVLAERLRRHPEAAWALDAEDPLAAIAALKARPDEVGRAARAYFDRVGYRVTHGYDIGDPYALELPTTLIKTLKAAVARRAAMPAEPPAEHLAAVRDAVPAAHRATFDELLAEARGIFRLRDERALYGDLWAAGLTRRALLVAGERLVAKGRLADPRHMVEAGYDEARALLAGGGPGGDELAERAAYRTRLTTADAPETLGPRDGGPPPAEWLPSPAARRAHKATMAVMTGIFKVPPARAAVKAVNGLGVNPGVYEGTARLVLGAERFADIRPGDVLVTRTTSPTFNVVLPQLGAIVTDRGGMLSHAAIVAREYGIPAVVGTRDATAHIPDGARVRVDGEQGLVEVLV